jgi:hypothetical protein
MGKEMEFSFVKRDIHVNGNKMTLGFIGDTHFNEPMFSKRHLSEWCKQQQDIENLYLCAMGDMSGLLSFGERKVTAGLHESTREYLDAKILDDIDWFCDVMKWTRDKWLFWICGNHHYVMGTGRYEGEEINGIMAKRLGGESVGVCALCRLVIMFGGNTSKYNYHIVAHHGNGLSGGKRAGATLNGVEDLSNNFEDIDIVMAGHTHDRVVKPMARIKATESATMPVIEKEYYIGRSGSFLRGYVPGKQSYVARGGMKPVSLGAVNFHLQPKTHNNYRYIKTTAETT